MSFKGLKLVVLLSLCLLIFLPFVIATPPVSIERYLAEQMKRDPYSVCYKQQGGDALFVMPSVRFGDAEISAANKTSLAERLCRIEQRDFRKDPTSECVSTKEQLIIALNPKETACNYAPNPEACLSCAKKIKFKQDVKEFVFITWIIGTPILLIISFFYLLVVGIFYLVKKRLLGKKWLFVTSIIIFIASFLSLIFEAQIFLRAGTYY